MVGRPPAVGLPSCLHAATGMEEVGWWGDPREGFILTDFVISAADFDNICSDGAATSARWEVALPSAGESFGLPGRAYKLGLRRVPLDRLGWSQLQFSQQMLQSSFSQRMLQTSSSQSQGLWLVGPAIDIGFLGDLKSDCCCESIDFGPKSRLSLEMVECNDLIQCP